MYPEQSPQPTPPPQSDDSIFMTKVAPPQTPEDKKKIALIATISLIIGFAVLVVGIFMLLFLGANNAASEYKRSTTTHVTQLMSTVQAIDIDSVLNQRDISDSIAKIEKFQHDRSHLASVLFANALSASYQDAEAAQQQVDSFYSKVTTFAQELPGLLTFARAASDTRSDFIALGKASAIRQSSDAQKAAGSIDDLAARVKDLTVPVALVASRDSLAAAYTELAEGYRDLAGALTNSDNSKAQAYRRIVTAEQLIEDRSNSGTFAEKVKQYVAQLVAESKTLIGRL